MFNGDISLHATSWGPDPQYIAGDGRFATAMHARAVSGCVAASVRQ